MNTVSLPQMLKFDRVLIERAIMNVISNGLDYSPQGGTLYVDVQSNNGFVEISVTDEGTGFSKEALCHAQERFYMGDQSRNSKLHFGMGLYITNSIFQIFMESSKIPLIMYLKKKHLPSGRKEKNRCWADPFSRLIYIHWWRF